MRVGGDGLLRGLDTNVLLRFLLRDDIDQWKTSARYIKKTLEAGEHCFINNIVLCETVWVLQRGYKFNRDKIADALLDLLSVLQFEFEDRGLVLLALQRMRSGRADFADYLIGATNHQAGCTETATFDRKPTQADGFITL